MNENPGKSHVIITGTTRGLGFCLCRLCLQQGYFVTGFARSSAPPEFEQFTASGQYVHIIADLGDLKSIESVFSEFLNRSTETVIINAADYSAAGAMNPDFFPTQLKLNLLFPILFIKKIMSKNLKYKPRIIFVSSIMEYFYYINNPSYGAAKAAVSYFINAAGLKDKSKIRFLKVIAGPLHERKNNLPFFRRFASITYQKAAEVILKSAENGSEVIYIPGVWKYIIYASSIPGKKNMSRLIDRFRKKEESYRAL